MRTSSKRTVLLTPCLALAALLALPVLAGPRPEGPHHRHHPHGPGSMGGPGAMHAPILEDLDLSEDQRNQVHEIMDGHRQDTGGLMEQMRDARQTLFAAVHAEQLDEAAIRAAAAAVGEAEAELALARAGMFQQILQVLTPEQRAEARELLATRHAAF